MGGDRMSSVYWDYRLNAAHDGYRLTRYDTVENRATVIGYTFDGKIEVGEYRDFSGGGYSHILRDLQYDSATDTPPTITWSTSNYDVIVQPPLDSGDNTVSYGDGNDQVAAGGGNDTINLGGGHNIGFGESGNDQITGGSGTDLLFGNSGGDYLYGLAKNDWMFGGGNNDALYGHGGNDVLNGGQGDDTMSGGAGDDIMLDLAGNNFVSGAGGEDFVVFGDGNDTALLDAGDDIGYGGGGDDRIHGGDGGEYINGGAGNDRLYGDSGVDILDGADGNDTIHGGADGDYIYGNDGADHVYGDGGDDKVHGGWPGLWSDGDWVYGGEGNDRVYADGGTDKLFGDAGDDVLLAVQGAKAYMTGGAGADTFVLACFGNAGASRILDFQAEDKINISNILQGWDAGHSHVNNFVRLSVHDTTRTDLRVNVDGTGGGWQTLAVLQNVNLTGLTASDLVASGRLVLDQPLSSSDLL
jgi:Ca2+-binding RTX toxin-like protein